MNNHLIDELLADTEFDVTKDGSIKRRGRAVGRKDREGYVEIYFRGYRLFAHRIVYRKFVGPFKKDMVIHHKNANTSDNRVSNLEQVTQKKNIWYRERRKERVSNGKR
jgi:hypothetical protein